MSYNSALNRALSADAGKSPMKYRNDTKWKTQLQNPFLASRRAVFAEQRERDQGVIPTLAAPSSSQMEVDTEGNDLPHDSSSVGDYAMDVDDGGELAGKSLSDLYDGDLSWVTSEVLKTTAQPTEATVKPKKQKGVRSTTAAEGRVRNWEKLLPTLEQPYTQYRSQSLGKANAIDRPDILYGKCTAMCGTYTSKAITCLFMEGE
jgi:hypothetical protein